MKRKSDGQGIQEEKTNAPKKRQKSSAQPEQSPLWPEYFQDLFKTFKAINTVLGFVSTRKQLATTFSVVKSSVESLLKQPLEFSKITELKAILPDLIKFAYIPRNELRVTEDSLKGRRENSPDCSVSGAASTSVAALENEDDHILILEFVDNARGKKTKGNNIVTVSALQPAAVKKLVEKRNKRFHEAISEFLLSESGMVDPVNALKAAAQAHIPVNPSGDGPIIQPSNRQFLGVPDPSNRPSIDGIVTELEKQSWCEGRITDRRTIAAKTALTAVLEPPLSPSIARALLDSRKITTFYCHQVAAIHALAQNKHVIVSTSTASGKSVIYQVPVLRFLEADSSATAIFVYPTKALAQDQKAAMEQLLSTCTSLRDLEVATYDGDTPQELRSEVRETASIIFTNFDMIHASILPQEELWRKFLKNIKLIVVDELHYYSGLFGSHVALILRRLRRVCAAVGNRRILFVSCSATITNPQAHMSKMFGLAPEEVEAITKDGAPSGPKDFLVWNPPHIDEKVPSLGRYSSLAEATGLMRFLMKKGVRVILFCKIRKVCELAMKTLRADLSSEGRFDILERTMPYRGGYSREDRRRIEQDAFNGRLLGVVATNALELGVDIGVLDAVIMLGFPVTIAGFRQQAGRAGRRSRDSLAVLVADSYPIDQYYVAHPEDLFEKSNDDLIIDLESKPLLEAHLQCAAQEMPLSNEDEKYFGALFKEVCESHLVKDHDGWYHTHPEFLPFPSKFISIRGTQEETYAVVNVTKAEPCSGKGSILEEVEITRAIFEIYEGGVFMHQGLTFIVKEVSHDSKIAYVTRADVSWITSPRDFTNIDAVQTYRIKEIRGVTVEIKVFGFFKIRNKVILEAVDLETPTWQRETTGVWIDVPKSLLELFLFKGINPAEAIHAAQHAVLNRFSLAQDLRTECKTAEKEYKMTESKRKRPARLIFYDAIDKGGGVAAKALDHVNQLLRQACNAMECCECNEGCTQCCQSSFCKENNLVCSKLGAHLILKCLLGTEIDPDSVPIQNDVQKSRTVVEAEMVHAIEGVQVETS
ncbi:putative ATP-dependent helicase HRQ1 [Termitomyces sp. T112]|nr:putative ATP-dependent helicase HRQ1 [Termitomyces sp. T112]